MELDCRYLRCASRKAPSLVARVRANERALAPVSEARRAAFAAHVARVATEALEGARAEIEELAFLADPVVAAACAICAGACCLGGGERAYLDARTLARFFAEHPEATLSDAIARYLGHVERVGYERSCVFHGARGCALPRALRAEPCREYECEPVRALARRLPSEPTRRALVIAGEGGRVVRLAVVSG